MTEEQLRKELERAYRAIRGFYDAHVKGKRLETTPLFYHSPVIAAAVRFVEEEKLDGAEYFEGKGIAVMQAYLDRK